VGPCHSSCSKKSSVCNGIAHGHFEDGSFLVWAAPLRMSTAAWRHNRLERFCFLLAGNIRNLAMEKVASTVLFPCKYATSGCLSAMLHTEKADHEEACEYRPYSCPCPGASCKWQGALEQVMPHLLNQHRSITTLQGSSADPGKTHGKSRGKLDNIR